MAKTSSSKGSSPDTSKKSKSKKTADLSVAQKRWNRYRTKRTEEIKEEDPDLSGKDRQKKIAEEWKTRKDEPQSDVSEDEQSN
ncbi:hypothetical protein JCM8547_001447 [Rhodosporidiobolus lusitaniae]